MNSDRGSGSLLAVALGGSIAAIAALALPLYMGLAARQGVVGAADAAALAAADTSSGRIAGYPCVNAERVAAANATAVTSCRVDGLVVTVSVVRLIVGLEVVASATAGPPPTHESGEQ